MAIKTITVDGTTYPIGVDVTNIDGTLPITQGGTGATTASEARMNLGLGTVATHAHSEYALTGHTHDYSKVIVTQTQASGTEVGKITVDGTTTTLYAPEDTDTKVTQTVTTASNGYPILASAVANGTSTTTNTSVFNKDILIHSSRKAIYIKGSGVNSGFHVTNANGVPQASLHNTTEASTSVTGLATLQLGGINDEGTIKSAGEIYLFNGDNVHSELTFTSSAGVNREHVLPNTSGYVAIGSTNGVGDIFSPIYMTSNGALAKCTNYKIDVPQTGTTTQTLPVGTYLMTINRTASEQTGRDGVWLLTTGTTYGHLLPIATGASVTTPTVNGKTVTVTGNTTQLQAIFRRIG